MGEMRNPDDVRIGTATHGGLYAPAGQTAPVVDSSNAIGSLAEMLGPTPAEREAAERRMLEGKAKMAAWTGLFDGLRQLGNLYYTSKGATPQNYANPYQYAEQQYQQQRQLYNDMANYRKQYATSLYSLQRQMDADKMAREKHQATLDWYQTRDEQNAEKVAIQRLRAENDAAYKEATLEEKKRMNDIMSDVYAGRISLMEAQEQLAKVRAAHVGVNGSGGRGNAGTTKVTTTGYDENGNKVVTTTTQPNGSSGNGKYDKYKKQNSSSSSNRWDQYKVQN